MKKNNTAEKTILDAENISKALKESTEQSLRNIVNEAISNVIKENEDFDDDEDIDSDESFEEDDVDTTNIDDETPEVQDVDDEEGGQASGDDTDDDEWSDMEEYKVGDNDYDFTNADGETVLKVYNKLGEDDKIFVKQTGEGSFEVKDEETGAEYEIELNADADEDFEGDDFDDEEGDTEFEIELDSDEEPEDNELDIEIDGDDEEGDDDIEFEFDGEDDGEDDDIELEIGGEDDEEDDDEINEENLGYTNNYQKDVMPGLKMNEPADKKTTYSMDAGAPDGNSRPYSGYKNKESNLFTKQVNECGDNQCTNGECEETLDETKTLRKSKQTQRVKLNRTEHDNYVSNDPDGNHQIHESLKKIIAKAKEIQAENKQYKDAIDKVKKSLYEAAVLNVTLGQALKLVCENSTTKEEKQNIVERFNNVKTIKESKDLYDTISKELNESAKKNVVLEHSMSANDRALNETTIYSRNNNPALQMMDRINNLENLWESRKK